MSVCVNIAAKKNRTRDTSKLQASILLDYFCHIRYFFCSKMYYYCNNSSQLFLSCRRPNLFYNGRTFSSSIYKSVYGVDIHDK